MNETTRAPSVTTRALETVKKPLRRARNVVRASLERAAHPSRRRAAQRRIQSRAIESVLFICQGNIYRSPYGAACLLSHREASGLRVESAGFVGPNRPSPADAQELARRRGVDLSAHRSRTVDSEMLRAWDLVVVMEVRQAETLHRRFGVPADRLLILGDLDPVSGDGRTIADPWKGSPIVLEGSYLRVERCVRELASLLDDAAAAATSTSSSEPPSAPA